MAKKPTKPNTHGKGTSNHGKAQSHKPSGSLRVRGVAPGSNKISAPSHLRSDTASWWLSVASEYELESHQLRLLTLAAEAWDRCTESREAIAKHGAVYVDRFDQPRARPEISIERDSRIAFARLVRELALDLDPPEESGRPPRLSPSASKRSPTVEWDEDDRRILGID